MSSVVPMQQQRLGLPRHPWTSHMAQMRVRWEQGEHILIAGPTSAGKSTLMKQLVQVRGHVVAFISKQHDDTFTDVRGWTVIREWKQLRRDMDKVLLWPESVKGDLRASVDQQRTEFQRALNFIGSSRGWCSVIDEMHYMASPEFCGLGKEIALLHHQGRSSKISMVTLTQRPSWIPKIIYSSVSHAYIARTRDEFDLKRLSDLGGGTGRTMKDVIATLPDRHDYVYVNSQGDAPSCIVNTRV